MPTTAHTTAPATTAHTTTTRTTTAVNTAPAVTAAPAATARQIAPPSIHLRALFTWMAVYTMLMATQFALGPTLIPLPMPVRTLVVTAIVVPTVVYALVPTILRVHATLRRH